MADSGIFNSLQDSTLGSTDSGLARGHHASEVCRHQCRMAYQDREHCQPNTRTEYSSMHSDLMHATSGEVKYFDILQRISSEVAVLEEILPYLFNEDEEKLLPREIFNEVKDPTAIICKLIKLMQKIYPPIDIDARYQFVREKSSKDDLIVCYRALGFLLNELHDKNKRLTREKMDLQLEVANLKENLKIKRAELAQMAVMCEESRHRIRDGEKSSGATQHQEECTTMLPEHEKHDAQPHVLREMSVPQTTQEIDQARPLHPSQALQYGGSKLEPGQDSEVAMKPEAESQFGKQKIETRPQAQSVHPTKAIESESTKQEPYTMSVEVRGPPKPTSHLKTKTTDSQLQGQSVKLGQAAQPKSLKQLLGPMSQAASEPEAATQSETETTFESNVELKTQLHEKQIQVQKLKAEIDRLHQELSNKSAKVTNLEAKVHSLEQELTEKDQKHENHLQALQSEKNRLELDLTKKLEDIQDELDVRTQKLGEIQDELDVKTKKLGENQDELDVKTKKLEEIKSDLEVKAKMINDLERKNKSLNEEITQLLGEKTNLKTLEEEIKSLKAKVSEKREDLYSAKDEINELKKTICEMRDGNVGIRRWVDEHAQLKCVIPQSAHEDGRITPVMSQFMQHVEMDGCAIQVIPKPGPDINIRVGLPIILPCIAASRVGSDISAALTKANIASGQVILVLFHHLAPHNSKINTPTEQRLSDRTLLDQCVGMVDAVFWNGAMYDCAANHAAVKRVQQLFRWSFSIDSVKELKRLV